MGLSLIILECVSISNEALFESFAGLVGIVIVAGPGVEGWVLEGASVAESDWPGVGAILGDGG